MWKTKERAWSCRWESDFVWGIVSWSRSRMEGMCFIGFLPVGPHECMTINSGRWIGQKSMSPYETL